MARPYKPPTTDTLFGQWLREARLLRGWTMEQLAARAESAPSVISNLERGERHPSRAMILRLAGALGITDPAQALLAAGFAPSSSSGIAAGELYATYSVAEARERTVAAYNNAPPEIRRAYDDLERAQLRLLDPFVQKSQCDSADVRRAETLRRQTENFDALAEQPMPKQEPK